MVRLAEEIAALHRAHAGPVLRHLPSAAVPVPAPPPSAAATAEGYYEISAAGGRSLVEPAAVSHERFTDRVLNGALDLDPSLHPHPDPDPDIHPVKFRSSHPLHGGFAAAMPASAQLKSRAEAGVAAAFAPGEGRRGSGFVASAADAGRTPSASAASAGGVSAALPSAERREAVRKLLQVGSPADPDIVPDPDADPDTDPDPDHTLRRKGRTWWLPASIVRQTSSSRHLTCALRCCCALDHASCSGRPVAACEPGCAITGMPLSPGRLWVRSACVVHGGLFAWSAVYMRSALCRSAAYWKVSADRSKLCCCDTCTWLDCSVALLIVLCGHASITSDEGTKQSCSDVCKAQLRRCRRLNCACVVASAGVVNVVLP